ncbi:reticulophagy regulator 2 [Trichomycterus rosablanca]|uniref:reticulophagy regulator 2 n=1 Tax=Trichomycterus rosablanca TaxID=2290929 RepID=UPI002F3517E1
MWSGEETGRAPVPDTACAEGVEALFAVAGAGAVERSVSPELQRLRCSLHSVLQPHERLLLGLQRLLVWDRPVHSAAAAFALNTAFWLLSSTSLRPLFLMSVCLLGIVLLDRWKDKMPQPAALQPEEPGTEREGTSDRPRLPSVTELSHHVAESYLTCSLWIQEMLQYKRQNPGKFCAMTCSGCLLLAIVGHYVPGMMISYIILLSVLLWPLVVYHELIQKMYTGLEPILMKLDYSMKGETQHRKHDKKKVKKEQEEGDEPRAETESESEEELSCFAPTVDVKTTALAMAITDSELSDEEASILESGGFSVSRATTPQLTDVSEDLDQQSVHSEPEESFSKDLPEFPSVEEFPCGQPGLFPFPLCSQEGAQSPASLLIQHLASPLHFVNTHFNGHARAGPAGGAGGAEPGPRTLEALSEQIVSTAISAVVRDTLSALLSSAEAAEAPDVAEFLPAETPPCPAEPPAEPPEDVTLVPPEDEEFELLDQSELEHMDEGLGFEPEGQESAGGTPTDDPPSARQRQQES